MISKNRFTSVLAAICSGIFLIAFITWLSSTKLTLLQGAVCIIGALLVCALLFMSISFIGQSESDYTHPESPSLKIGKLVLFCVLWTVIINGLLFFVSSGMYPVHSTHLMRILNHDLATYETLANSWYTRELLADFPLYSVLVNVFNVTGNFILASVIVSGICAAISGISLYYLALLDLTNDQAMRAMRYFYIIPTAFFMLIPLPASMLMMFSILFIYFLRKKFYINALMTGFCATLCGLSAILLIIPALLEIFLDYKENAVPKTDHDLSAYSALDNGTCITVAELSALYEISQKRVPFYQKSAFRSLYIVGLPLGFGMYLFINNIYAGNPFYFIEQNQFTHLGAAPAYILQSMQDYSMSESYLIKLVSIPNLICFFGIPIILLLGIRKIRSSLLIYALVLYIFTFSTSDMQSAFRHIGILFPLAYIIALRSENKTVDIALSVVFSLAFAGYLITFIMQLSL